MAAWIGWCHGDGVESAEVASECGRCKGGAWLPILGYWAYGICLSLAHRHPLLRYNWCLYWTYMALWVFILLARRCLWQNKSLIFIRAEAINFTLGHRIHQRIQIPLLSHYKPPSLTLYPVWPWYYVFEAATAMRETEVVWMWYQRQSIEEKSRVPFCPSNIWIAQWVTNKCF